ncbi:hypothetical protein [Microcella sp.]|uniref:hypothetical protein n=1 Tax=Microcella sp. TaxID=1913979 RepID=UPI003F6F4B68
MTTKNLRLLAVAAALTLALTGCSTAAPVSTDEIIPDAADAGDTGGDAGGGNDGQVTVIGADLTSSTAALLAEVYAEGRDPIPTVEFLDATTVRFAWPAGSLSESDALGNCQIAYGALNGEGIRVLIAVGDAEADCTADVEG